MKIRKFLLLTLLTCTMLVLTGCGKKTTKELNNYKANVEAFFKNIAYLDKQINQLDGSEEEDVDKLLEYLDTLDKQFSAFADLKVPEQFANVDNLADEASENMKMAVDYYHQAFDGEDFNVNYADAAFEYYSRANLRINYILKILHGETIDDENVVYTEEEPHYNGASEDDEASEEYEEEPEDDNYFY